MRVERRPWASVLGAMLLWWVTACTSTPAPSSVPARTVVIGDAAAFAISPDVPAWPELLRAHADVQLGTGYLSGGSAAVAERIKRADNPDILVLALGGEDLSSADFHQPQAQLVAVERALLAARDSGAQVVVVAPLVPHGSKDSAVAEWSAKIGAVAQSLGLRYVEPRVPGDGAVSTADGNRFSPDGQRLIADQLAAVLNDLGR